MQDFVVSMSALSASTWGIYDKLEDVFGKLDEEQFEDDMDENKSNEDDTAESAGQNGTETAREAAEAKDDTDSIYGIEMNTCLGEDPL